MIVKKVLDRLVGVNASGFYPINSRYNMNSPFQEKAFPNAQSRLDLTMPVYLHGRLP
jgi:hypothetical protein